MKAEEIKEAGYYRYSEDGEASIVHAYRYAAGAMGFVFGGKERPYQCDEMPGEFAGPLDLVETGVLAKLESWLSAEIGACESGAGMGLSEAIQGNQWLRRVQTQIAKLKAE